MITESPDSAAVQSTMWWVSARRRVAVAMVAAFVVSTAFDGTIGRSTAGAAGPRTCADSGGGVHEVRGGDTWFDIAAAAGVSMRALLSANDADVDDAIHPGDQLCLPAGATAPAPSPSAPSCDATASYTVRSGDSWFGIARRLSTGIGDLFDANDAQADTTLQPGDRLCLPAGVTPTVATNTVLELDALPVQGPCWYGDTWKAPRGAGRRHEGVDLIVESGKYVYAVADGVLTRRAWDQPGSRSGNAWWLTTADGTYYFYAHLSDFAPGLATGSRVEAGEIIGFVGNTGNSATAHLHFEIHPYGGDPINPYPTVRAAGGCNRGAGYTQPGGWTPET